MKNLINTLRSRNSLTENGMLTHSSSLNANLDFFFLAGASRTMDAFEIRGAFAAAFEENPLTAMRLLFWARDVRGGAGERRAFRLCLQYLATLGDEALYLNLAQVPEFGRWDDLFELRGHAVEKQVMELIREGLYEKQDGLLAKWLPRKGTFANRVRKHLKLSPAEYRKLVVGLSKTVEQQMCKQEWEAIEYPKVPSQAMNRYRQAFIRQDPQRFAGFISRVEKGLSKINAGAIYPHQLFNAIVKAAGQECEDSKRAIVAQWDALPNYLEGSTERIIPICDTSGSMTGLPMAVSVALGLYISERNESIFKDAFITFSEKPQLQYLTGDLFARYQQLNASGWGMNTNLEAVFQLLLDRAEAESLPAEEMPGKLLIISDMEFDQACSYQHTAMDMIEECYKKSRYERPGIIFWNVKGRLGNVPTQVKVNNTGLVSGFSPSILQSVLQGGDDFTPMSIMQELVGRERYRAIRA